MKLIIGNWKMNKTVDEAIEFGREFKHSGKNKVIICPSYTELHVVRGFKNVELGAQSLRSERSGTFTGSVSARQMVGAGCKYVIVGHSERRFFYKETDGIVNKKMHIALEEGIVPVFCIGEQVEERATGRGFEVIERQMAQGLEGVTSTNFIVAYEPVWAISGGDPSKPKPIATKEQIQEMHGFIKKWLETKFKTNIPVVYGGSANDKNCDFLFSIPDVDGVLVGAASLCHKQFTTIANS